MSDGMFRKLLESLKRVKEDGMGAYNEEGPLTARKLRQMLFDVQDQDAPLELITDAGDSYTIEDVVGDEGGVQVHLSSASGERESEEEIGTPEDQEAENLAMRADDALKASAEGEREYESRTKSSKNGKKMKKMGGDGKGQMKDIGK